MDHLSPRPDLYDVPFRTDEFNGMPYRYVGASGLRAPAIGLGTWKFGYPETGDGARVDARTAFAIFDRAVELGVTFWDTANRYNAASGNSERVIGRWFASNPDQRRNVLVATKMAGGMDGTTPNHSGLSRANIVDSVRASLARLQLDYVDLLWFHRFDALDGERAEQRGVLRLCAERLLAYVPYSPLAKGLLTGRYLDPGRAGAGDRLHDEGSLASVATEERLAVVRRLAELADSWHLQLSQLTLAYLLTLPGMGPQIPSSSTVAQLESNAAAGKVELTDEQVAAVRNALA